LTARQVFPDEDNLWYKDAVIYELHVRAFCDSDGDGIGDFKGLTGKLDYLRDLGVTAIWLLPFYPSPLRDDGYDIADYYSVHPDYGTLKDFRDFLREAHKRGIRVITELVVNHTSDQHPWFQKSRTSAPGSKWRDFYVWNDTPEKYRDARIIFKDFESSNWAWDPVAKAYYWHRFYYHQPDLNYDSPHVRKTVFHALDYWFEMGVDGLRLDAIPYLFEREGTNCENLPETYAFLKELRAHVDKKFRNRLLLAEANQWPEDATRYFGDGDECHMAFHFPLMPRMFMAIQRADRFPIIDILDQTPPIPDTCQWAMFLRNHDELTLEMVTDEERDYMYKMYARDFRARINLGIRRRLAPLMENDRRKMELMNTLLFTLPGTPILYYGDEIGMGDNYYLGDRNGVRTPMQWGPDRNAGFSRANPQMLYMPVIMDPEYHYEALNVENQQRNHGSLLWWMKRMIAIRKKSKAFGRGLHEFIVTDNPKILSFLRRHQDEIILVVINLSRFSQTVELDLSAYAGFIVEDVFSQNEFPPVRETPYLLTLGPYGYYLFNLKKSEEEPVVDTSALPEIRVRGEWERVFSGESRTRLEREILPPYLRSCRWFGAKARKIRRISIVENIPIPEGAHTAHLLFLEVDYTDGLPDVYLLPVSYAVMKVTGQPEDEMVIEGMRVTLDYDWLKIKADRIVEESPHAVIANIVLENEEGVLFDSTYHEEFRSSMLNMIVRRRHFKGEKGEISGRPGKMFGSFIKEGLPSSSQVLKTEQTNTSVIYENIFFFKLYRRFEEGANPDPEITRFLTEKTKFSYTPPFAGAVEYKQKGLQQGVICLLQGLIPNQGDVWTYTLDSISRYFDRVLSRQSEAVEPPALPLRAGGMEFSELTSEHQELIGGVYPEIAALIGKRTGELHLALASAPYDPDFAPEQFSMLYQRSLYQSMRSMAKTVFESLKKSIRKVSADCRQEAEEILSSENEIIKRFGKILEKKFSAMKTRVHGDYHLGQVLYTGKDFIIIDFEGEPARALSERRLKRSPLVDVAGMTRSFHYAAHGALFLNASIRTEDKVILEKWVEPWYRVMSGIFLHSYLETVKKSNIVPSDTDEFETLFQAFLLEKAVYELGYELNNRPDWLIIPVRGIKYILSNL
jgi:maltose alpha-D-glucosyltransferase/alpha-amylase